MKSRYRTMIALVATSPVAIFLVEAAPRIGRG